MQRKCWNNKDLIDNGFKIAIDDFGTGFSNVISLIEFPISTLKIDKSIIDNIECEKNRIVFKSIVNLGRDLDFRIIAEGVETKKQVDILTELGCNGVQGYYFYKPLPKEEIDRLLQEKKALKCDKI
ncbi:MAG: EAL domain-containing protein [Tissierellia bacterium]|nr:EAL domain-containing protein [Tissierellia bacterium]